MPINKNPTKLDTIAVNASIVFVTNIIIVVPINNVVALTNKRLLIATKRILWGYFLVTITPDMFNDLTIRKGIFFGSVLIDTVKEKVALSNIDPKALPELETIMSEYMMEEKRRYINESVSK